MLSWTLLGAASRRLCAPAVSQSCGVRLSRHLRSYNRNASTAEKLLASKFWNQKLDRAVRVRDADGDGVISLSDFELILKRYSEHSGASKEKLEESRRATMNYCTAVGLTDASKSFTYDQMKKNLAKASDDPPEKFYSSMFDMLDVDNSDTITLEEWQSHYKCLGIDPTHAHASFEAMDLNGDGTVSRDEFVLYHCEFFHTSENKLNSGIMYGPLD